MPSLWAFTEINEAQFSLQWFILIVFRLRKKTELNLNFSLYVSIFHLALIVSPFTLGAWKELKNKSFFPLYQEC